MGTNVRLIDPGTGLAYRAGGSTSSTGSASTSPSPSPDATNAVVPVVAGAGGTALLVKASAGNLYNASMVAGATAGFFIAYNAASAPAPAAALVAAQVLNVAPVAANGYVAFNGELPDRFGTGIVLLFSTATTTYTVPASPALHIRGAAA